MNQYRVIAIVIEWLTGTVRKGNELLMQRSALRPVCDSKQLQHGWSSMKYRGKEVQQPENRTISKRGKEKVSLGSGL